MRVVKSVWFDGHSNFREAMAILLVHCEGTVSDTLRMVGLRTTHHPPFSALAA